MADKPLYKDLKLDDSTQVHYVEAGSTAHANLLLLHGFPSSSTQYREFIPLLSDKYHIVAPDLPGFGLTKVPQNFEYKFENLADIILKFLKAIKFTNYAVYIFDYGAPVALRIALKESRDIKAIITQNGNAYDEGFGHPFWDPIEQLWTSENAASVRQDVTNGVLTLETTKFQYIAGTPESDLSLINPITWHLDYLQNIQGAENQRHQLDLFYDYRTNKAMYPKFQEYLRQSQVPLLAIWGKNDPAFIAPGAEAFRRDLPNAVIKFVDAGHFALETQRWEIAQNVREWLASIGH